MKLVNNGRKAISTKAQYEREPLAGCYCSSGAEAAQTTTRTTNTHQCVCQCNWRYKSNNASSGKAGSSRDGQDGSSSSAYIY